MNYDEHEPKAKAIRALVTKPVTQAPVDKMPEPVFELLEWRGKPMWQCRRCKFNALDERSFWGHWMTRHQPPRPSLSALVDKDGKPIEKKEG